MAICRICGVKFKENYSTGERICHNDECWKQAWNEAVSPFRETKKIIPRNYRKTSIEEKERVASLYRSGKKRRQIADEVGVSYKTVCNIIKRERAFRK